jgi:hypothetical protein
VALSYAKFAQPFGNFSQNAGRQSIAVKRVGAIVLIKIGRGIALFCRAWSRHANTYNEKTLRSLSKRLTDEKGERAPENVRKARSRLCSFRAVQQMRSKGTVIHHISCISVCPKRSSCAEQVIYMPLSDLIVKPPTAASCLRNCWPQLRVSA